MIEKMNDIDDSRDFYIQWSRFPTVFLVSCLQFLRSVLRVIVSFKIQKRNGGC